MKKRRTRKEKIRNRSANTISWKPVFTAASVNRQITNQNYDQPQVGPDSKKAMVLDQEYSFVQTRNGILKSIGLSSLIMAIELVIYFAWPNLR